MLEKIVVGYASDQAGRDALALAARLAVGVGGRLTIVFPYHPMLARETSEQASRRIMQEIQPQLQAIDGAEAIEPPAVHWSPSSWPIRALHELAGYEQGDLIVFGAARQTLADHLHFSLMERMVHGAPCAVAVAPEGYADSHGLHRIGVGFSSSAEGLEAIAIARELARLIDGEASVTVIAGAGLEPALASYAFSSPGLEEVESQMYIETEETLARTCQQLGDGLPVEHETIRGDPARVLIERTAELDLLVLGSRAYGPLRHVLLGSVSARVMREARCPVLVVPRGVTHGDGHTREQPAHAAQRD